MWRSLTVALGRRHIVDDALGESVDAEGHERLIADDPEGVYAVGRYGDRDTGLHDDRAFLAVEPSLTPALEHGQHLGIGVRVQQCRVARLRGLNARADRHALAGVVADDRLVLGSA